MIEVEKILNLIRRGESLKSINRSGWILAGVKSKKIESVAEHSYGCIFTSIIVAHHLRSTEIEIDIEKVALMAILHDLPESITGDIARTQEFTEDKARVKAKEIAESTAFDTMIEPFGKSLQPLHQLWNEFNIGESLESRVVKGADIIDMLVHARSLEESGTSPEKLHQFFETSQSVVDSVDIEIISEIYNKLLNEHDSQA